MGPRSSVKSNVRRLGAIAALLTAGSLVATPVAMAAASVREPGRALPGAPSSGMTLAQAPQALQAAVRSTLAPSQQAELTAADAVGLGASVGISGSTAVVGAPSTHSLTGAAYVFVASGGIWTQQAELIAPDGATLDFFGGSVAISGSTVVVGATGKDAAYVFVRSGTTWTQQAELTASDGAFDDAFGASVGVSGSTAVVGAPYKKGLTGAAYVFVRAGGIWSQQTKLTASDGTNVDKFGYSVAISGSTALVGANGHRLYTGAAYVFVRTGTTWTQQAELTASDGAMKDSFGQTVALSGSTAAVGAYGKNGYLGAAYVFVRSGTTWTKQAELTASDAQKDDWYAWTVAVSGSTVAVGAWGRQSGAGATYIYTASGGIWSQRAELTASDGGRGESFGVSLALNRSTLLVGAIGHGTNGTAYVFVSV